MSLRGRPRWYKPDVGLSMRMLITMLLLGAVYVVFGAILIKLGYGLIAIPLALIIGITQLFFADKIALASMGAHEVDEAEAPQLHDMIGRLALQANLPKPKIAIINTSLPNAFATGRNKDHAVVAVTTGILNQLSEPELEAVIAHELTHVINRDMLVMTIATFFSMVASLIVNTFFYSAMWGGFGYGRRRDDNAGYAFIFAFLASIVTYVLSFLLIRALSRYRELAADRGSALITGAPQNLASALLHIDDILHNPGARIPDQDFRRAQAVNALFIVPAIRGDSLAGLFSTHPPTQERVERLRAMQRQMESAGYIS
jgi:heat shock protein HtpX